MDGSESDSTIYYTPQASKHALQVAAEHGQRPQDEHRASVSSRHGPKEHEHAFHVSNDSSNASKPLGLLNLPIDLLQLIMKETTHTNDLCSLALTCSKLHTQAVPHIYSRFDIVWPEAQVTVEGRPGVDALTHGLATLVMREEPFLSIHRSQLSSKLCATCGQPSDSLDRDGCQPPRKRRRGNDYAIHTKKFSLGNGPYDSIKDYNIKLEAGKMLGTLAAVAIGRMRNLETFMWDMPTGIVRDVWLALASLEDRAYEDDPCRLHTVWVRFHNNHPPFSPDDDDDHPRPPPAPTAGHHPNVQMLNPSPPDWYTTSTDEVERPNFSIIPTVKSLGVVDIDEVIYLDEISVAIAKSAKTLSALRIGIAGWMDIKHWVESWEAVRGCVGIGGLLFSKLPADDPPLQANDLAQVPNAGQPRKAASSDSKTTTTRFIEDLPRSESHISTSAYALHLKVLALERVPLAIAPFRRHIDWTKLQELTLLGCDGVDSLWKHLRKVYAPARLAPGWNAEASRPHFLPKPTKLDFLLILRHLHVDHVSLPLLNFIRDALAPDSLEVLFLQNTRTSEPETKVGQIFKLALKRHRRSLIKLSIDTIRRRCRSGSWAKKWDLDREHVRFIFEGNMPKLRELCFSTNVSNWHFLIHRLHLVPHLRSIYVPWLDHDDDQPIKPKDFAIQAVDAIALRPEIELCFLGVLDKCFEVLEGAACDNVAETGTTTIDEEDEADTEDLDDDDEDDDDDDEDDGDDDGAEDGDDGEQDGEEDTASDWLYDSDDGTDNGKSANGKDETRLRLREILFYDDRISIFKIRHGRLRV